MVYKVKPLRFRVINPKTCRTRIPDFEPAFMAVIDRASF